MVSHSLAVNNIERPDALYVPLGTVHVEGDAHIEQGQFDSVLTTPEFAVGTDIPVQLGTDNEVKLKPRYPDI